MNCHKSIYNACFTIPIVSSLLVLCLFHRNVPAEDEVLVIKREKVKQSIAETVTIGQNMYIVPPPWAGNRIIPPKFSISDFRQLPPQHCKNNSKIYVHTTAYNNLTALFTAALNDGIMLQVESGYRSLGYQKTIFFKKLAEGRSFEDIVRYVAPPGYSQHMLGIAVDFYPSNWQFASSDQYNWLKENAHKYNFEETYSEFNRSKIPWEAWHWSYTGPEELFSSIGPPVDEP